MPLYAFGSNGSGQLGIQHVDDVSSPTRCSYENGELMDYDRDGGDDVHPIQIRAGGNHTIVLFSNGRVCITGDNEDGRCGTTPVREQEQPCSDSMTEGVFDSSVPSSPETKRFKALSVKLDQDPDINQFACIAATWSASFVVDAQTRRNMFVFGSGSKGELGLGSGRTESHIPTRLSRVTARDTTIANSSSLIFPPPGSHITTVAAGMGHIAVLLSNGDVYGWGQSRKGQLGSALAEEKIVWEPSKITGLPFIPDDIACGKDFTIIGSKQTSQICVLGTNRWQIASIPESLKLAFSGKKFCSMQASWHGAYVLCADGSLLVWGRNDRGQIPLETQLPKIKRMAIGSEHVVLLTEQGKILACGWGEHGNCGAGVDDKGDVKQRPAEIHLDLNLTKNEEVIDVGAGCATSWIVTRAKNEPRQGA